MTALERFDPGMGSGAGRPRVSLAALTVSNTRFCWILKKKRNGKWIFERMAAKMPLEEKCKYSIAVYKLYINCLPTICYELKVNSISLEAWQQRVYSVLIHT